MSDETRQKLIRIDKGACFKLENPDLDNPVNGATFWVEEKPEGEFRLRTRVTMVGKPLEIMDKMRDELQAAADAIGAAHDLQKLTGENSGFIQAILGTRRTLDEQILAMKRKRNKQLPNHGTIDDKQQWDELCEYIMSERDISLQQIHDWIINKQYFSLTVVDIHMAILGKESYLKLKSA